MQSFVRALVLAFLAFAPLIADAYASNGRRSGMNGARLARGLPPAPPKRLYHPALHKARDDSPSGIATVTSTSSSTTTTPTPPPPPPPPTGPAPGTTQYGYAGVFDVTVPDQPTVVGYFGLQSVQAAENDYSVYSYTVPETAGTPAELGDLYGYSLAPSLPISYTATSQLPTLGPGQNDYLTLRNVVSGSIQTSDYYNNPVLAETDVWIVDPTTGNLSVQWTNSGGDTPQTYLFVDTYSGNVYVTGDPTTLASQLNPPTNLLPATMKLLQASGYDKRDGHAHVY